MEEIISDLIGAFYDCALEQDLWLRALERLGDTLGGAAFVMSAIHRSDGLTFIAASRQDPWFQQMIAQRFADAETNPLIAEMPRLELGYTVPRHTIYSDDTYFRESLWNEVFRPQGLFHQRVACLLRDDEYVVPFGILTQVGSADFSAGDLNLLNAVLPHIRRAIKTSLRMEALVNSARLTADALDRVPLGLILVDRHCRALHVNAAASQLVAVRDGLRLRSTFLAAESHDDTLLLGASVARVIGQTTNAGEMLTIRRSAHHRPHMLLVAPIGPDGLFPPGGTRRRALIVIGDLERQAVGLPGRLIGAYGLSPAEAQLAGALLSGEKRLEELALLRGVTINTVKSQLKSIFLKTGTARQGELIRLLSLFPDCSSPPA